MLQARRSFTTSDAYGEIRVTAQRTCISESHELASRFPDAWIPCPGRESGAREVEYVSGAVTTRATATRAPLAAPRGNERWRVLGGSPRCSVSRIWSSVGVRLSEPARQRIDAIVAETSGIDGLEIGGILLGRSADDFLDVLEASGPGPRVVRRRAEFRADRQHDRAVIDAARERGYVPVGSWHTHPSGAMVPSPADVDVANGFREMGGMRSYLEIIVSRDGDGWGLHGWITTPRGDGLDRCQPIRLSGSPHFAGGNLPKSRE